MFIILYIKSWSLKWLQKWVHDISYTLNPLINFLGKTEITVWYSVCSKKSLSANKVLTIYQMRWSQVWQKKAWYSTSISLLFNYYVYCCILFSWHFYPSTDPDVYPHNLHAVLTDHLLLWERSAHHDGPPHGTDGVFLSVRVGPAQRLLPGPLPHRLRLQCRTLRLPELHAPGDRSLSLLLPSGKSHPPASFTYTF